MAPPLPRLAGVVIGNGQRQAIFVAPDGTFDSVTEGEQVGAYAVTAITIGSVQLRGPSGTYTLHPTPAVATQVDVAARLPDWPSPDAQQQAGMDNNK